uniref:Uncharacterized protein n=1 Tax=Wuchereria bancrofti TaxID=6293 RepID=A0AAF5PKY9_WUCBA
MSVGECCSLGCRAEKSIAEKCKANNFFSTAINMVSGLFVFKGEDECEQHYKVLVPLIQCHKTVDYWFNEERLKIDTSKSTILRVGLKPVRNTVSSNRRLSTEYISFNNNEW